MPPFKADSYCIPWRQHHRGPDLDQLCVEKGEAETVSPQSLEEIPGFPSNTEEFLCTNESILMGNITVWYSTEQGLAYWFVQLNIKYVALCHA